MESTPLVSVCIPAYNAESYIAAAIESVVSQTYQHWELIIVDNASKDNTFKVISETLAKHGDLPVHVYRNEKTLPMAENWNVTIAPAKGEFIKLLCADDLLACHCLELQVKGLMQYPSAVIATGTKTVVNAKGRSLFNRCPFPKEGLFDGVEIIRRCLHSGTNIVGEPPFVMWRASRTEAFDPEFVYSTDIDLWLKMLGTGDLYSSPEPVGFFRIHGAATTASVSKQIVRDFLKMAQKHAALGGLKLGKGAMFLISIKSYLKSVLRQCVYRLLSRE